MQQTWTWKAHPDSYQITAEHQLTGGSWMVDDTVLGSCPADENGSHHEYWYWSPNQYTWGYKWNQTTDFVYYYQHFWYWNDTWYPSSRGQARLANMKNDQNNGSGHAFQHEYRRVMVSAPTLPQDGWDAKSLDQYGYPFLFGYSTNLPSGYSSVNICEEFGIFLEPNEEAEVKTTATDSMNYISGADPTNTYARSDVYTTWFKFYRQPAYVGTNFLMQTKFENLHYTGDPYHDTATATEHTTAF